MRDWALPDISDLRLIKTEIMRISWLLFTPNVFRSPMNQRALMVLCLIVLSGILYRNIIHHTKGPPYRKRWQKTIPIEFQDTAGIATPILGRILAYYRDYDSSQYVAPYAYLVGPSGIGKTFAVEEMARQGTYVMYTSLARLKSRRAYLRRSVIADRISSLFSKDHATQFFECFTAASLVNVRLCRIFGILPIGSFDIQTRNEFLSTQLDLKNRLIEFFKRVQDWSQKIRNWNYGMVAKCTLIIFSQTTSEAEKVFSQIHRDLKSEQSSDQYITDTVFEPNPDEKPLAIICFDEAQELFEVNLKFLKKDDKS